MAENNNQNLSQNSSILGPKMYWSSGIMDTFFKFWFRVLDPANTSSSHLKCRNDCTPYLHDFAEEGAKELYDIHGIRMSAAHYLKKLLSLVNGETCDKWIRKVYRPHISQIKHRIDFLTMEWQRIRQHDPVRFFFSSTHHHPSFGPTVLTTFLKLWRRGAEMNEWNYHDDASMNAYAKQCIQLINEPHGVALTQYDMLARLHMVITDYNNGIWYTTCHLFKEDIDVIVAHTTKKGPVTTTTDSASEWEQESVSSSSSDSSDKTTNNNIPTPKPSPPHSSYTFTCTDMTIEQVDKITSQMKAANMDVHLNVVQVKRKSFDHDAPFLVKSFLDIHYIQIKGPKHTRIRRRIKVTQLHRHFEEWYVHLETNMRYRATKVKEIFAELLDMTVIGGGKYYIGLKPKCKGEKKEF